MSRAIEIETSNKIQQLNLLLSRVTSELKSAVELSIEIRRESPEEKHNTILLWEQFLGQLFGYIKQRSKESKDNLLSGISLTRLKFF